MPGEPGGLQIPQETLYKKNVLLVRGRFRPFTLLHNDMLLGAPAMPGHWGMLGATLAETLGHAGRHPCIISWGVAQRHRDRLTKSAMQAVFPLAGPALKRVAAGCAWACLPCLSKGLAGSLLACASPPSPYCMKQAYTWRTSLQSLQCSIGADASWARGTSFELLRCSWHEACVWPAASLSSCLSMRRACVMQAGRASRRLCRVQPRKCFAFEDNNRG